MKLEHEFTVPAPVDEAWKVLLDVERVAPCMPGATLLTVDGNTFTGTVKVKVGPIQVTYKGQASFAELDEQAHRAVIEATGKEARGNGTAAATVTAVLTDAGTGMTKVQVETDLNVTGRPAQFGRGVMAEVGGKLIGQFAGCLADELGASSAAGPVEPPADAAPEPGAPAAGAGTGAGADPAAAAAPPLPPTSAGPVDAAPAPATPLAAADGSVSAAATGEPPSGVAGSTTGPRAVPSRPAAEPIDLLDVAGASVAKRVAPVGAVALLLLILVWWRRRG